MPTIWAAISTPSIIRCGSVDRYCLSLNVPGSPSSPLTVDSAARHNRIQSAISGGGKSGPPAPQGGCLQTASSSFYLLYLRPPLHQLIPAPGNRRQIRSSRQRLRAGSRPARSGRRHLHLRSGRCSAAGALSHAQARGRNIAHISPACACNSPASPQIRPAHRTAMYKLMCGGGIVSLHGPGQNDHKTGHSDSATADASARPARPDQPRPDSLPHPAGCADIQSAGHAPRPARPDAGPAQPLQQPVFAGQAGGLWFGSSFSLLQAVRADMCIWHLSGSLRLFRPLRAGRHSACPLWPEQPASFIDFWPVLSSLRQAPVRYALHG